MGRAFLCYFYYFLCYTSMQVKLCKAFIHTRATSTHTGTSFTMLARRQGVNTATTASAIFSASTSHLSSSDESKDTSTSTNTPTRKINILCLHGKGNNGKSFQEALTPLEESLQNHMQRDQQQLSFHFEYITAPFPMEAEQQQQMQWWTLPPGVRSFNAKEYQGFQQSAEKVMKELQQKHKYDFILGHSQGAILLSALLASKSWAEKEKEMDRHLVKYGYIFNGCAWPNPFTDDLEGFQYQTPNQGIEKQQKEPQVLFIVGEKDKINPPEGAIRVRDALICGGVKENLVQTLTHPGGHAVPVKNVDALDKMTSWIMNVIDNE